MTPTAASSAKTRVKEMETPMMKAGKSKTQKTRIRATLLKLTTTMAPLTKMMS
jgi:hypothetical protein